MLQTKGIVPFGGGGGGGYKCPVRGGIQTHVRIRCCKGGVRDVRVYAAKGIAPWEVETQNAL